LKFEKGCLKFKVDILYQRSQIPNKGLPKDVDSVLHIVND